MTKIAYSASLKGRLRFAVNKCQEHNLDDTYMGCWFMVGGIAFGQFCSKNKRVIQG